MRNASQMDCRIDRDVRGRASTRWAAACRRICRQIGLSRSLPGSALCVLCLWIAAHDSLAQTRTGSNVPAGPNAVSDATDASAGKPEENATLQSLLPLLKRMQENAAATEAMQRQLLAQPSLRAPNPAVATEAVEDESSIETPARVTIPLSGMAPNVRVDQLSGHISLHVRDASLRDVLTMIAQQLRINIVVATNVSGQISITLEDVTVEDALNAMLASTGNSWTRVNGIIHITSLQATANLPAILQDRVVRVFELDFAAAADLDAIIKGMLSPVGTSQVLTTDESDNRRTRDAIVVEDVRSNVARIEQYICQLDVPPRQVMIEAYVLEIELSDTNRNGVNLNHLANFAGNSVRLRSDGFANPASPQAFFLEINGQNLTGLIELLESTADAKTLASPKVLAVNGQKSRIQIGERLGYRVTTTTETSSLESVEFIDVGVVLDVTPRITRDGRVMMQVKPEVSGGEIDPVTGLPSEETTEVETSVLLDDGKGIVIGGLIQERDIDNQSKIPGLGDLKWVGPLFQRRVHEKKRTEIIVVMLPHVVPYRCDRQVVEDVEVERATTPLLWGPLDPYPRPWEARLHNPYDNPKHLHRHEFDFARHHGNEPCCVVEGDAIGGQPPHRERPVGSGVATIVQTPRQHRGLPSQDSRPQLIDRGDQRPQSQAQRPRAEPVRLPRFPGTAAAGPRMRRLPPPPNHVARPWEHLPTVTHR